MSIRIIVEKPCGTATFKECFRQIIDLHDSVACPYEQLISSLKFLFGKDSIINFQII